METEGVGLKNDVVLSEAIDQIQSIFPDLPTSFIILCLEHYGRDGIHPEKVIEALVEDKLPPSLVNIKRDILRDTSSCGGSGDLSKSDKKLVLSSLFLEEDEIG